MIVAVESKQAEEVSQTHSLVIVRHPQEMAEHTSARSHRFRLGIGSAIVAGVLCGVGAVAVVGHQQRTLRLETPADKFETTQTVVPVAFQAVNPAIPITQIDGLKAVNDKRQGTALEQIRTRNRRLEALVKVLRRRDSNERKVTSGNKN